MMLIIAYGNPLRGGVTRRALEKAPSLLEPFLDQVVAETAAQGAAPPT